jgi:hypothetical protein
MARFMTRVELHNASSNGEDYTKLHAEMESRSFSRHISSSDATYQLPPAEYYLEGDYERGSVLASAKVAAEATGYSEWTPASRGKTYAVVVTEATMSTWCGLRKA